MLVRRVVHVYLGGTKLSNIETALARRAYNVLLLDLLRKRFSRTAQRQTYWPKRGTAMQNMQSCILAEKDSELSEFKEEQIKQFSQSKSSKKGSQIIS